MRAKRVAGLTEIGNPAGPGYAKRRAPGIVEQQFDNVIADGLCATCKRKLAIHHVTQNLRRGAGLLQTLIGYNRVKNCDPRVTADRILDAVEQLADNPETGRGDPACAT